MNSIECQKINKTFPLGIRRKRKVALENVSFLVKPGEVFGIIGPNGAGKSTTLKILLGFIKVDSGKAFINGQSAGSVISRKFLGYLPENTNLYPNLSLSEHLRFACRLTPELVKDSETHIDNIVKKVNLEEAANIPIRKYSKGMTQRAGLAYAIINNPEILIMDEPMSGLDPLGRQLIIDIIKEYNEKGTTILFCSHILTDVERICDRIAIMNQSRLITITTPEQVQQNHSVTHEKMAGSALENYFLKTLEADIR